MKQYLPDPSDHCRQCSGSGTIKEKTPRGTTLYDTCEFCGGTGLRSIGLSMAGDRQLKERASPSAHEADVGHPKPVPTDTDVSRSNRVQDQWITDHLPVPHITGWDEMRYKEAVVDPNVHDPVLRELRASDYLIDKLDQRDFRHGAMFVATAAMATLITFAAIAAP